MLKNLDHLLTELIRQLEVFYVALGRVGEYVLEFITRTFEGILRVLRRAISILYRFLRDLLVNLVKIGWRLLQLALVPLFFVLLWGFGSELWTSGYWKLGISLEVIAAVGLLLFAAVFLASLTKSRKEAPSNNPDVENLTREKGATIQFAFLMVDLIALGLVLWVTLWWAHWFSNPVLRVVQIVECRLLLVGLSISNEAKESDLARLTNEAVGPFPLRAGTESDWPTRIKDVPVTFSQPSRRPEAFGTVGLDVLIGSHGKVRSIIVTESVPFIDEEVIAAVRQWEYKPMVLAGQSVPVILPITYTWAGDSAPKEILAQLNGRAGLKKESVFGGRLKNSSTWTIGWVSLAIKGPKETNVPVKWERKCQVSTVISPGQEVEFLCRIEPVDLLAGANWDIVAAWGLP